jgi:hypothetical protein
MKLNFESEIKEEKFQIETVSLNFCADGDRDNT